MGVNIAAMREYFIREKDKTVKSFLKNCLPPAIGTIICFYIWWGLPLKTFIVGGAWMAVGIVYLFIRTNGFRKKIEMMDYFDD